MKKYLFLLLASFLFLSCQKKADDIKLNSLSSPCDYNDAMSTIMTEMVELYDNYPNEIKWVLRPNPSAGQAISNEHAKRFEELFKRLDEINQAAYKKYTFAEFKECTNHKEYGKLFKRWNKFMKLR